MKKMLWRMGLLTTMGCPTFYVAGVTDVVAWVWAGPMPTLDQFKTSFGQYVQNNLSGKVQMPMTEVQIGKYFLATTLPDFMWFQKRNQAWATIFSLADSAIIEQLTVSDQLPDTIDFVMCNVSDRLGNAPLRLSNTSSDIQSVSAFGFENVL